MVNRASLNIYMQENNAQVSQILHQLNKLINTISDGSQPCLQWTGIYQQKLNNITIIYQAVNGT